jgi:lipoprotein NlpI
MARPAIAICLLPALLLAGLLGAGGARADSPDELQIEGKLDVIELGGEAAHKETVEGMITDLTPEIDSGRLTEAQLVRALAVRCWAYYEKDLFDLAVADCNRVLASRPDHGTALLLRASSYIREGKFTAAVGDLDHAIADGGLEKDDLAFAYLRRGIAREAMGDGKDAAEDVRRAVSLDPKLMDTYQEISKAMLGRGKAGSAVESFDQAMALDPKSAKSYLERGVARMARDQLDGAIADFDKALEIDPHLAAAFQHRGDARLHRGLDREAIEDFDRALDLDAHVAPTLKARALAEFKLGHFEDAAHDLAASVKADATDPYAVLWLYLVHRRVAPPIDTEASVALMKQMSALTSAAWPAPVLRFYTGRSTETTLRAAAQSGDAKQRLRQACDAAFYAGEQALVARDAKAAAVRLQEAAGCPAVTAESVLAKAELARLAN